MTPAQKPDPRRSPLPYQTNLRLSDPAYRGALMLAHSRGVSVAQVVRDALDRELRRFKSADGASFLNALEADDDLTLTADELADLVGDEDGQADG